MIEGVKSRPKPGAAPVQTKAAIRKSVVELAAVALWSVLPMDLDSIA